MDVRKELSLLGFEPVGTIRSLDGGTACRAELTRDVQGFVVYAHVVGDAIMKFGTTRAPLRKRVGQNANTINQGIALAEGRARDARWHHRPFDAFKRMAPKTIRGGQSIEIWVRPSTKPEYLLLERELNARFDTMHGGWAMQLG